jgi:hypothetical protein
MAMALSTPPVNMALYGTPAFSSITAARFHTDPAFLEAAKTFTTTSHLSLFACISVSVKKVINKSSK